MSMGARPPTKMAARVQSHIDRRNGFSGGSGAQLVKLDRHKETGRFPWYRLHPRRHRWRSATPSRSDPVLLAALACSASATAQSQKTGFNEMAVTGPLPSLWSENQYMPGAFEVVSS